MPSVQETAYPRLKSNLTVKELTTIYTPTVEELAFAKGVTASGSGTRLGLLILLKTFQRLGYAVPTQVVPSSIIRHIAAVAHLDVSSRQLADYDASVTRRRHLQIVRDYLQLHPYNRAALVVMEEALRKAALTKQDLADLINVAIEELVHQRFELPAFSTLKRIAQQIRTQVATAFYQQVNALLTLSNRQHIGALFEVTSDATSTLWNGLKQDVGNLTLTHLRSWIERLQKLQQLQFGQSALIGMQ